MSAEAISESRMGAEAADVLRLDGVTVGYGGIKAVVDVSLSMRAGDVVGVMGPNGAGKSSLLNCIAGLVGALSGQIFLDGRDITRMPAYRRARGGIAVASQRPRPIADLTVEDHVLLGRRLLSRGEGAWEVSELLAQCGLDDVADRFPEQLSPSQLRRLELAKALAPEPALLLLDEVGAGLPAEELTQVVETVRVIAERGAAVLVVDHVMELLLGVSQRLIAIDLGHVIADGEPHDVVRRDEIIRAYFGTERPDAAES